MKRTVKMPHQSKILGNGIFLTLVLVGDDCNVARINAWMKVTTVLPKLSPGACDFVSKKNSKSNRTGVRICCHPIA
jgi:hypothetical protein